MAVVTDLWRYAVKGLDRDVFSCVELLPDAGFPKDRTWALHFVDAKERFDGAMLAALDTTSRSAEQVKGGGASRWVHKSNFLCAFTAPVLLGQFETEFDNDKSDPDTLVVRRRSDGRQLLVARLTDAKGRERAEAFFTEACGRAVRLVKAVGPHHFGNTPAGFTHHPSGCVIHLVNAETVASLSEAASTPLHASRFRPNIVVHGLPAWSEFDWVGRTVGLGGARLEVLSRTVRCDATNSDARHEAGDDLDVPKMLATHFPQHGPYLGIYLRVVQGGEVRVGDTLVPPPTRSRSATLCSAVAVSAAVLAAALLVAVAQS